MAKDPKQDAAKALDMALGQIEKQFGKGSVMKMGDKPAMSIESILTGALALDVALGIGGLPRGRVTEIYGPESSGKSTLAMHVVAEAQRTGGTCAYIDAEHAMDPVYAAAIGVDIDQLYISPARHPVSRPGDLRHARALGSDRRGRGRLGGGPHPACGDRGEMGDVGLQARLMSQALRKLTGSLNKTRTICVFINQLREKIGHVRVPETTPVVVRSVLQLGPSRHPPHRGHQGQRRGGR
ncbi:MAG: ATPase domain-containing protein [Microthrixaceae bacterium]